MNDCDWLAEGSEFTQNGATNQSANQPTFLASLRTHPTNEMRQRMGQLGRVRSHAPGKSYESPSVTAHWPMKEKPSLSP